MGFFFEYCGHPHRTDSGQRQAINQSCPMGSFTGHCAAPPTFLCYRGVSCDVQNTWQSYQARFRTAKLVGETCIHPSPCLGFLSVLPNTTNQATLTGAVFLTFKVKIIVPILPRAGGRLKRD